MASSHPGPPDKLDEPLELDPEDWAPREVYFLMTGLVIPRPIAWVSTTSPDGIDNVAPHSYFNLMAHDPPHIVFSSSGPRVKDTFRNISATREFVVNLVSQDVVEAMNLTATDFPPEESEFDWAELTRLPSARVAPPRVGESSAHLECQLVDVVEAGNGRIIIGRVVHVHVEPRVWRDGRVQPELLDPVCRLAGTGYATLGEVFKLPRPTWADVQGRDHADVMPRRQ